MNGLKTSWIALALLLSACATEPQQLTCECDKWLAQLDREVLRSHEALRDVMVLRQALKACEERR